jgi:hypothetical protein
VALSIILKAIFREQKVTKKWLQNHPNNEKIEFFANNPIFKERSQNVGFHWSAVSGRLCVESGWTWLVRYLYRGTDFRSDSALGDWRPQSWA